jgi:hypothetical protein
LKQVLTAENPKNAQDFRLQYGRYSYAKILSFKKFCARENCEHLKIGILRWIWAVATAAVSTYCKGATALIRRK